MEKEQLEELSNKLNDFLGELEPDKNQSDFNLYWNINEIISEIEFRIREIKCKN